MNNTYLLIGGNEGNRLRYLEEAGNYISGFLGDIVRQSAIYETAAWGKTDQPNFFNQTLLIQTAQDPNALMNNILMIEKKMGRIRNEKYSSRTIDIDILFYNAVIINEPRLIIPHPEIQNRRFVLVPMNEIAGELIHPVLNKTIKTLLAECPDKLDVTKI